MLIRDHFQNFKSYQLPKAQLIIADVPYNLGNNAYASNPAWYKDGDNKNGESDLAGKQFFDTDNDFKKLKNISEYCIIDKKKVYTRNGGNKCREKRVYPLIGYYLTHF